MIKTTWSNMACVIAYVAILFCSAILLSRLQTDHIKEPRAHNSHMMLEEDCRMLSPCKIQFRIHIFASFTVKISCNSSRLIRPCPGPVLFT